MRQNYVSRFIFFTTINAITAATEKLITKGYKVSLKNEPINIDNNEPTKVDKAPTIAAPIPAIFPKGSIAKALKLPKVNPKQKKVTNI